MTPGQCRAARAWLDWTQDALAARAGTNTSSVLRFEGREPIASETLAAIQRAFNKSGIRFLDNGIASSFADEMPEIRPRGRPIRAGGCRPLQPEPSKAIKQTVAAYRAGKPTREIARMFGITKQAVHLRINRYKELTGEEVVAIPEGGLQLSLFDLIPV
jgi:Homeodomain-like domain